jgi:hypothetical protein
MKFVLGSVVARCVDPLLHLLQLFGLKLEFVRILFVVVEHGKRLAVVDAVGAAEIEQKLIRKPPNIYIGSNL